MKLKGNNYLPLSCPRVRFNVASVSVSCSGAHSHVNFSLLRGLKGLEQIFMLWRLVRGEGELQVLWHKCIVEVRTSLDVAHRFVAVGFSGVIPTLVSTSSG